MRTTITETALRDVSHQLSEHWIGFSDSVALALPLKMSQWLKIKGLAPNLLKDVIHFYATKRIPIEVRDLLAVWVEGSLKQSSSEKFCIGLRKQLQDKISSLSNDISIPFYVRGKLVEFDISLSTCNAAVFQDIYQRFEACLEFETQLLNKDLSGTANFQTTHFNNGLAGGSVTDHHATGVALQGSSKSTNSMTENMEKYLTPMVMAETPNECAKHPLKALVDAEMAIIMKSVGVLEETSNNFSLKVHELKRLQGMKEKMDPTIMNLPSPEFQILQTKMAQIRNEILEYATHIYSKLLEVQCSCLQVIHQWGLIKMDLDKDLSYWVVQQKRRANGQLLGEQSTLKVQSLSECLMEIAWQLRGLLLTANNVRETHLSLLQQIKTGPGTPDLPQEISLVTSLIRKLVQDTFLVVHQPCQVLKTNTRFHVLPGQSPMEVCSLVGEKLGLKLSPPTVSVCIVDENMTQEIHKSGLNGDRFRKVVSKGRLLPDTARLDFSTEKQHSAAVFRQISLKDFCRNARKGNLGKEQTELVTEEKFALLFRSDFTVGDIEFKVWRLSLPIVIITHGSQESLAWAAISWDNQFSQCDRIPFQLPDYVSWQGLSEMMNGRFKLVVGSPLSNENMTYLAERFSKCQGFPEKLTWAEVCKNNLPGKKFTIWDWFYEGAKLIEQYLKVAWNDGHVVGFIGKERSEDMLRSSGCLPGTFLLRFSESILGGLSIVWLHSNGTPYSLAPFKNKDLAPQPFVEKLNQKTLHYVYPNVEKEVAFQTYYEEASRASVPDEVIPGDDDRYIRFRNEIVLVAPSIPQFSLNQSSNNVHLGQRSDDTYATVNVPREVHKTGNREQNFTIDESAMIDVIDEIMSTYSNGSEAYSPQSSSTNSTGEWSGNVSVRSVDEHSSGINGSNSHREEYFYLNL